MPAVLALNSDELQILRVFALGLQAELGGLSNAIHQLIERLHLGVASLEFRDRSNAEALTVPLDDDVAFSLHDAIRIETFSSSYSSFVI
jgi:hypothetical protein